MAETSELVPLVRSLSDISLEEQTRNECRVILVGKTGNGKSSIGNRLLNKVDIVAPFPGPADDTSETQDSAVARVPSPEHDQDGFEVNPWCFSCTKNCQFSESHAWDKKLKVIDTAGIFDTNEDIKRTLIELTRCMSLSAPGPHAVVFVVRLDTKFTCEEEDAFNKIVKLFGEGVKRYLIVAFTRGEILGRHRTDAGVQSLVSTTPKLKRVLEQAQGRYAIFSFLETEREKEVRDLLEIIDRLGEQNKDPYYQNETLRKQGEVIQSKVEKLRKKFPLLTHEEALLQVRRKIARSKETKKLLLKLVLITGGTAAICTLIGVTGGLILGAAPLVAFGLAEGAAIGAAVGGASGLSLGALSVAVTNLVAFLKGKAREQTEAGEQQEGENPKRSCVIS